jgi:hypothetical protein
MYVFSEENSDKKQLIMAFCRNFVFTRHSIFRQIRKIESYLLEKSQKGILLAEIEQKSHTKYILWKKR